MKFQGIPIKTKTLVKMCIYSSSLYCSQLLGNLVFMYSIKIWGLWV